MTDDGMVSPFQCDNAGNAGGNARTSRQSASDGGVKRPRKRTEKLPVQGMSLATATATLKSATLPSVDVDEAGALASVIALDIIPRLLMGHRVEQQSRAPKSLNGFTDRDRAIFLADALELSASQLSAKLRDKLMRGCDLDSVLLDLMAPVARTLGEMWERDSLTFIDVTIAVQKMQQVLRDICQSTPSDAFGPHALLLPAPGETHSFGLVIVSELFRKRGWYVAGGLPVSQREIVNMVQCQPFAVVGFSLSHADLLGNLKTAIAKVRKFSINRDVLIVVGGRVFDGKMDVAVDIGADAAFADAAEVIAFADKVAATVADPGAHPRSYGS
jgi:MerR family transcriptional regulator, light-induced transcriptional regulator